MVEVQDRIRAREQERTLTFRVEGRGTMRQGPIVRRFAERALDRGRRSIRVDLSDCSYMDSTFLGTLLFLKGAVEQRGGDFLVVCPSAPCARLLEQMGLDETFKVICEDDGAPGGWVELNAASPEIQEMREHLVRAHQELANLPGPAGTPFRELAARLTREYEEQPEPKHDNNKRT